MVLDKIRVLCDERKISIAKLEKETGIGNGTISRWDISSPTVTNLKKVANYFEIAMGELLDEMKLPMMEGEDNVSIDQNRDQ
jgi:transcriptional regulator, XRE|nr:MAG TPA: repressor protein [Caudoviricetes sp.]DAO60901.1 MAG TPA: repressor protein [Herelleviridae sp.]